jgi:LysM repeat protein
LGSQAAHARPSFTRRLQGAATPAIVGPVLVGAVAAVALANGTVSASVEKPSQAHQAVATALLATTNRPATPDGLLSASRTAVEHSAKQYQAKHRRATASAYTVKAGDTLSSIAGHVYHSPRYWTVLYWANHKHLKYANELQVGQVLAVPAKPAKIPAAPKSLGPAAPVEATSSTASQPTATYTADTATVSTAGESSFQACVIERESGGNPQVMNSSGHYGLYQFSESTWVAYGGSAADFGDASVAEQNQVFDNAIAAGGESNWSAYDGC